MSRPRVLAACTTAIGDTMFCSPALIAMGRRFDVDVLVHQKRRPLLRENPYLNQVFPYRNNPLSRTYLAAALAGRRYESLVVLHANDDLIRLMPRLRYQRAVNIQGWDRPDLNLLALPRNPKVHSVDERLVLAQWAGAEIQPQDRFMRMFLRPRESEFAEKWLRKQGMRTGSPRVGLVLGASASYRRWPAERFGRVAAALHRLGMQVIYIGDSHEKDLARRADEAAGHVFFKGYNLGLRLLGSVLSRLDLVISNDTGPLHLGQAVQTPVLGLFGPTDPVKVGPRGPRDRVVKVPATCDPCLDKGCRNPFCMEQLSEDMVIQATTEMLELEP
ncbi:MAG: glycosyltransferase family 9 protein [Desulfarculaceae bacterium]|nr:glycosyltransferase family 9 protein [Desulfarculaceae bacterium]MCF8072261.1 glycosyltransferase family 9 protein [Desulfarculaceae bacterium]MCF8100182.1 glycosyltransferase family 9 protein [Desulfarculaceae bacterium]MCF8117874.1 glycosyltransferase family 9 protein [Desulfarculaceae bacterium]